MGAIMAILKSIRPLQMRLVSNSNKHLTWFTQYQL